MIPGPAVKIVAVVPMELLQALAKHHYEYTTPVSVFHTIQVERDHWIGVVGDGDNGSYEWFSFCGGQLATSDCGYGMVLVALRDIIREVVR